MSPSARSARPLWSTLLAMLLLVATAWWLLREGYKPERAARSTSERAGSKRPSTRLEPPPPRDAARRGEAPSATDKSGAPSPPLPAAPQKDDAPQNRLPHPRSTARERLLRERAQFEAVVEALDRERWTEASRLLGNYSPEPPDDKTWEDRVLGFRIILACRTQPSPQATAAARDFIDNFAASTIRRRVRRECLP